MPDEYIIVFTSDIFHANLKSYEHKSCVYPAHLRIFACIIENNYVSITDEVSKMFNTNKCVENCPTYEHMPNENIHDEGHILRYVDTHFNIDNLPMGKLLLGDLENIGWVVLKCDYLITPKSNVQNYVYVLNNNKHPSKDHFWN